MTRTAAMGLLGLLWASPALAQTCSDLLPDLTPGGVAQITGLTGTYLGVCWLGRIMIRMMT